jgi:hypothetical protein
MSSMREFSDFIHEPNRIDQNMPKTFLFALTNIVASSTSWPVKGLVRLIRGQVNGQLTFFYFFFAILAFEG